MNGQGAQYLGSHYAELSSFADVQLMLRPSKVNRYFSQLGLKQFIKAVH